MRIVDITQEQLLDLLPHGSGIDYEWSFEFCKNGTILCRNCFHAMNAGGYYDGVMPFKVRIFEHKETHKKAGIDFSLFCNENRKVSFYGLREYLEATVFHSLESILDPFGI